MRETKTLSEIRVRDPFILADPATKTYYLYAQKGNRLPDGAEERGVEVYRSPNLREWSGPVSVFEVPVASWARESVWAPEVHRYQGRWYLFVTLTGVPGTSQKAAKRPPRQPRGTQIFVADAPTGPFHPIRNTPHTPKEWMCLDGTLFVEDGKPHLVFCREWIEVENGTIEAIRLNEDLSATVGKPTTLFHARDAVWVRSLKQWDGYVTDGPFFYRTRAGRLLLLWSSFGEAGYALAVARSESGKLSGPWRHETEPLFSANGGHAMLFRDFDGRLLLTLHQPNGGGKERARLFEMEDEGERLRLVGEFTGVSKA